jgi:hypothetical protein
MAVKKSPECVWLKGRLCAYPPTASLVIRWVAVQPQVLNCRESPGTRLQKSTLHHEDEPLMVSAGCEASDGEYGTFNCRF